MRKRFLAPSPQPAPVIPRPGEGKRGAEGHIGYLLRQAHTIHRIHMEHALAEFGVTPPQFSVLTMLHAYAGASNADVARLSLLTPQTVSVIVGNLEKMGAIARRPDPTHGRIQQLEVTATGRKLLTRCRQRVQQADDWLLEGMAPADERVVRNWLGGIARRQGQEGE